MPGPDVVSQSHSVAFRYQLSHLRGSLLTSTLEEKQNNWPETCKSQAAGETPVKLNQPLRLWDAKGLVEICGALNGAQLLVATPPLKQPHPS